MKGSITIDPITIDPIASFSSSTMESSILRLDKLHPIVSGNKWFKLRYYIEDAIAHIPLVKIVYSSIKDFFSAFVSEERKFNKPALIKMGGSENLQRLGFITETDLSHLGLEGMVSVYIPHSYNFSGNLFIVKAEDVTPIKANTTEVMKFIVSGGVTKFEH